MVRVMATERTVVPAFENLFFQGGGNYYHIIGVMAFSVTKRSDQKVVFHEQFIVTVPKTPELTILAPLVKLRSTPTATFELDDSS